MTGFLAQEGVTDGPGSGATHVLTKRFRRAELLAAIAEAGREKARSS